jgi:RHS repeat-associated protein
VGPLNCTTKCTAPLDRRTERTYDAISRLVGIKDPRGFVTAFRYDDANRVRQILDARNGQTQFGYDLNGNLLTVTDAKSQTTTYTYDSMDRLATRKDGLNRTETYGYDLAGNLTSFLDRKNQTTTFSYDALNRRTGATYPDATVTFGYDAINRLTSVNDSVGGTITWTYDTVSGGHHPRVLETTSPGTVTVEYDEIGRRFKLSATGLTDVTYAYDNNSLLTGVTQGTQTVTLAYDDAGRRTSLTYPNAVVTSYGYDNANRLLTINHVKTPTTIEALTYQYDSASNRVSLDRANAAASLIPTAVSSNSYDAVNEQTQFNGVTQTFDSNGNLTNDGTNTYTWDARNRLTAISGGVSASFTYDGLGRRKSKNISGTTTGFWYDGNDILAELSGGTPSVTYIRGISLDEAYIRKGTGDEFYQTDALGSSVALTDGAGASQTTYTYQPFGGTTQSGTASSNAFHYTGRENDGTGLYNHRARYYYPKIQRFISEDPIGFKSGDANFYNYVTNAPLGYVDPFGFDKCQGAGGVLPLGESYGEIAAMHWAERSLDPTNSWIWNALYFTAGSAASLWTPCSSLETAAVLLGSTGLGRYHARPFWQYYPENVPGYQSSYLTRGWGWEPPFKPGADAVQHLSLPPHNPGTSVQPVYPAWWEFVGGPKVVKPANNQPGGGWEYKIGSWP